MRRSGGLRRTAGLTRRTELKSKTEPQRKAGLRRTKPMPKVRPAGRGRNDPSPEVRAALWLRCAGVCEWCSKQLPEKGWHAHHRRKRRNADNTIPNLVAVHSTCHYVWPGSIHEATTAGRARNFVLISNDDPAEQPIRLYGRTWVHLSDDGSYLRDGELWHPVPYELGEAV